MRRVMSLWLPNWPLDRRSVVRRRRAAAPPDKPAVIVEWIGARGILAAVDPRLAAMLAPGMPLADAQAIEPGLAAFDADPAGDAAALGRLAAWCGRYSPWTAPEGADGVWLDVTGSAHLRGGEAALAAEIVNRLKRDGIAARAAIADTPGAAWAVAREAAAPATVIPPGAVRVALALLPVRGLRIPAESAALLERLGLRRIGDLYKLPRPALVARFGLTVAERLDQALGELPEPLSPLPPAPLRSSRCRFAEPIATPGDLAAAIGFLAEALARRLETSGMGARRLVLRFHRVDGEVLRVAAGTAQASRDARHFIRLFLERLDGVEPGLGIEEMDLEAAAVEPLGSRQAGFAGEDDGGVTLAALIDRLENRLGAGAVGRWRPRDSHIPERAVARVPALAKGAGGQPWNPERPRPVRLLPRPEPIEAVAPVPDDPPVLFRWRRLVHRVRAADGPERILGEWWRESSYAGEEGWRGGSSPAENKSSYMGEEGWRDFLRDYYCVEDIDGRRFWLFRAGLHQPGLMPRWFLHGVFA